MKTKQLALEALKRIARPHGCGCVPCTGACRCEEAEAITTDAMRDIASEASAALEADIASPAPTWMPIETAPKDGTMILLGRPESAEDDSGPVSTAGRWQEGWEDSVDDMGCDSGFVDVDYQEFSPPRSFGVESYRTAGRQPTHWIPLPPAPGAAS